VPETRCRRLAAGDDCDHTLAGVRVEPLRRAHHREAGPDVRPAVPAPALVPTQGQPARRQPVVQPDRVTRGGAERAERPGGAERGPRARRGTRREREAAVGTLPVAEPGYEGAMAHRRGTVPGRGPPGERTVVAPPGV